MYSTAMKKAQGGRVESQYTDAHCTWFCSDANVHPVRFGNVCNGLAPAPAPVPGCSIRLLHGPHLACFSNPSPRSLPDASTYCSWCQWDNLPQEHVSGSLYKGPLLMVLYGKHAHRSKVPDKYIVSLEIYSYCEDVAVTIFTSTSFSLFPPPPLPLFSWVKLGQRGISCRLIKAPRVNELPTLHCLRVSAAPQEINKSFNHEETWKVSACYGSPNTEGNRIISYFKNTPLRSRGAEDRDKITGRK